MDFQFFESMTRTEAEGFLSDYLRSQEAAWNVTRLDAQQYGICCDFSVHSVPQVMRWLLEQVRTVPTDPDIRVPPWIRETASYQDGLFDFDEPSKTLVIRASYYLGAAFVAEYNNLSWSTGRQDFAEENMPVVTGFMHELELAPILVTENLYRRILAGEADDRAINVAIDSWSSSVPE